MSFWSWQRRGGGDTAGSAALAIEPALGPVELYTRAQIIHGAVASSGRARGHDLLAVARLDAPEPDVAVRTTKLESDHGAARGA